MVTECTLWRKHFTWFEWGWSQFPLSVDECVAQALTMSCQFKYLLLWSLLMIQDRVHDPRRTTWSSEIWSRGCSEREPWHYLCPWTQPHPLVLPLDFPVIWANKTPLTMWYFFPPKNNCVCSPWGLGWFGMVEGPWPSLIMEDSKGLVLIPRVGILTTEFWTYFKLK